MMKVVATTEAISCAKLQSKCHYQQTNTQFFYRPDALPVTQPSVSKHWRETDCMALHCIVLFSTALRVCVWSSQVHSSGWYRPRAVYGGCKNGPDLFPGWMSYKPT